MIESLENNEVILLMYLAGELPPEDREEVGQMLDGDATLRAELDRLQDAYDGVSAALQESDEASPLPATEAAAARRIGRMMRQHIADRSRAAVAQVPSRRGLRYAWWAYPTAAAAAILLAFLTWWGNHADGPARLDAPPGYRYVLPGPLEMNPAVVENNPDVKMARELERTFRSSNDADNALLALRDDSSSRLLGGDSDE